MKSLPIQCPSCGSGLSVKRLLCQQCETEVEGFYQLPVFSLLPKSDQEFILLFIKASGSLKEMARVLGLSYPTVRNRLDEIIERLTQIEKQQEEKTSE